MKSHRWIVPLWTLGYTALGELAYRGDRPVRDAYGHCVRSTADHDPLILGLAVLLWLAGAALLACSPARRWRTRLAGGTALAVLAGAGLGFLWYRFRMEQGAQCPLIEFSNGYSPVPWLREALAYVAAAGVLAALSIPWGYLIRGVCTLLVARGGNARP
jgi:hypothetical protein